MSQSWLVPPVTCAPMSSQVTISLPDGSAKVLDAGATTADLAASIGSRLAKAALAAKVNGEEWDLNRPLPDGATVAIITAETEDGRHVIRHSTSHVMAQAVLDLYPGAKYTIGPAIENGFYYDFDLPNGGRFLESDLERIEGRMREIVKLNQPFTRGEVSLEEGLAMFADQPYKLEIIQGVGGKEDAAEGGGGTVVSFYRNREDFVDLCRGPHVPSTGRLGAFKLMKVAGAYWRGDEKRPMLQRIYGTAWESPKALQEHLTRLEEAEKRDHRKLAVELDLLSFPNELGGGLAVWHPKGSIIRKLMEDYSRKRHQDGGYEFAYTPHLANQRLFQKSGHLDFYKDGMYPPMEMDNGVYYPKPMNCPMHTLIFSARQRSYRELPLRLFELGTVYRYERAGTLHGLLRIRGFTQDDAHIFCTQEQLAGEIISLLHFVIDLLRSFGFDDFEAQLATRDPDKSIGEDAIWETATEALRAALVHENISYQVDEGGAAFYGPKIDVKVRDAIGRQWQLSTIQADFNLPDRFDLEYVAADNTRKRPIMLHRALFGSLERFFGVLLEHYAGAFPTWLSPIQVQVLGVRADHDSYVAKVVAQCKAAGLRVDTVPADEPLGARIRKAKLEKIPFVLVVGDDDVAAGTVGVNARGADVERGVAVDDFVARVVTEVGDRVG
jgi:threonyl-tRNA synthetase